MDPALDAQAAGAADSAPTPRDPGITELGALFDALAYAVMLCDRRGEELLRSRAFDDLLRENPEPEILVEEVRALAASLGEGPGPVGTPRVALRPDLGEEPSNSPRYRLRAAGASFAGTVVVAVQRLEHTLPSVHSLGRRHGLTLREAQITLLLAAGRSNREIAERLGISAHTVRTHAEHIFEKMGIRSRKALALRLLERSMPGEDRPGGDAPIRR